MRAIPVVTVAGVAFLAITGCQHTRVGFRMAKSPADDFEIRIIRNAEPLPDDCQVYELPLPCHIGSDPTGRAHFAVTCEHQPPEETRIAGASRCMWPGTQAAFLRAVCRSGGDTIVHSMSVTHSCVEEHLDEDGFSAASMGLYTVYRLRH